MVKDDDYLGFRLPRDLKARFSRAATELDCSITALMIEVMSQWLVEHNRKTQPPARVWKLAAGRVATPKKPTARKPRDARRRNPNPKPISLAKDRTQLIMNMLLDEPLTAHEIAVEVMADAKRTGRNTTFDSAYKVGQQAGMPTHHNRWSLARMGFDYGLDLIVHDGPPVKYQFVHY